MNGPFLAREVLALGIEPARITIVGDAPEELEEALADGLRADLCIVTGGLGPTHDDRTVELVARATQRKLLVDPELERTIEATSRAVAARAGRPYADFAAGVRKQATVIEDAEVLGVAGTAPALLLETGEAVVVVLPGPPSELRRLWPRALAAEPVRRLLARTRSPHRRILRFFGVSESAVARALDEAGGDGAGVEATICARELEIHVDLLVDPGAEARAAELEARLLAPLEEHLFARDERGVEEHVLALCRARGLTVATAESCTGGMVAARLTDVPGSSDAFVGGVVAYADRIKQSELRVPQDVLARHGAVSAEVAAAMASGAATLFGADVAVAVTGIAGPGGGTAEKPVGLVFVHGVTPGAHDGLELHVRGDRDEIRRRATVASLHLARRLLTQDGHEDV